MSASAIKDLKPWTYQPKELFDLGGAGEHQATIFAWIDEGVSGGGAKAVNITRVHVDVQIGGRSQMLDVTYKILNSPYTFEAWQLEIWRDYVKARDKDFSDSEVGA